MVDKNDLRGEALDRALLKAVKARFARRFDAVEAAERAATRAAMLADEAAQESARAAGAVVEAKRRLTKARKEAEAAGFQIYWIDTISGYPTDDPNGNALQVTREAD